MVSEALIARCAREEPKAQAEMYRTLYGTMMAICSRYERNEQDALARMNEGFLKILTNIPSRRPEVPFEPWARRIMINTVIDEYRRNSDRRMNEVLDTEIDGIGHHEVNDYLRHMEADAFAHLLEQLPDMSRRVFNLFAIDGYAHNEIAEMLGISVGTSKWHVSNARQLLRNAIASLSGSLMPKTALR